MLSVLNTTQNYAPKDKGANFAAKFVSSQRETVPYIYNRLVAPDRLQCLSADATERDNLRLDSPAALACRGYRRAGFPGRGASAAGRLARDL